MKEVRVLHIVTKMNRAGLENRLMDLYRQIDKDDYQFDFFTFSDTRGFYDDEISNLGGRVFYSSSLSFKTARKLRKQLFIFLEEHPEYKIVHCHLNQWCGLILKIAKKAEVPIRIAHSRTSLDKLNIKNIIKNAIKLSTNKYATHKMAVSKKAAVWLFGQKAVDNNDVYILPNSIDIKNFTFDSIKREKYRDKSNVDQSLVVIHVGNFKPEKNHEFLLDIFKSLNTSYRDSKLILIGSDNMNGKIQKLVYNKRLERDVIILGSQSNVNNWLNAGDVFVFPSLYEGFPGSVLEAQASGLPCIISDTITEEVCVTDRIIQLPLNAKPEIWANKIIDYFQKYNKIRQVDLSQSKFNIESSATELINFYEMTLETNGGKTRLCSK